MFVKREKLRSIIREEVEKQLTPHARVASDSLDDQIDSLLLKFEQEATASDEVGHEAVEESWIHTEGLKIILEKPEDDPDDTDDPKDDDKPGDEEGGDEPASDKEPAEDEQDDKTDSSDMRADQPAGDIKKPKLDIDEFAFRIVRLINHMDALLDPSVVIINRAKNFLEDNYGPEMADSFEETLDDQYGISLHPADNEPERPAAVGAGPAVG